MKTGKRFAVDHLPFGSLALDPRAQREFIPARMKKLVREWKLEEVGAITVSVRDGAAYVIDGQHRVRAAMELGLRDTKVLCHVYRGLSLQEEAEKFLALNDVRAVSPVDKFYVGLTAKDPVCIGVRDTLAKHDLYVPRSSGNTSDGAVRCVSKLLELYERDPALLDDVCSVLSSAWGTRSAAYEQMLVVAMGTVCDRYNGQLDRGALVKKLAKYRGGPSALSGDARGLADYKPISVSRAAAEIIVSTYNRGRRSGELAPL